VTNNLIAETNKDANRVLYPEILTDDGPQAVKAEEKQEDSARQNIPETSPDMR